MLKNLTSLAFIIKNFHPQYTFHRCSTHIHCVFATTVPWLNKYYMRSPTTFLHGYCIAEGKFFFYTYLTSLSANF